MYDEMAIIGLRAFSKMVEIEFPVELAEESLTRLNQQIQEKLNAGFVVQETENGFTPLMLYSTYHVLDERFESALLDVLAHTNLRGERCSTSRKVNALSCAVSTKNIDAVKRLLDTGKLTDPNDYEVAMELSALSNFAEVVPVFKAYDCNLFTRDWLSGMSPLMYACALQHINFVRQILSTNPFPEELNMSTTTDNETAASLALKTENAELIALFDTNPAMKQQEIIQALENKDLAKIKTICSASSAENNLLIVNRDGLFWTLLVIANTLPMDKFREDSIELLDDYLQTLSFQDQINTLVITYSMLISIIGLEKSASKYLQLLTNTLENNPQDRMLKKFIMPMGAMDWAMTEEFWEIIKHSIFPKLSQKIEFTGYCPSVYDEHKKGFNTVSTINLHLGLAVHFVSNLLDNEHVTQCNLLLETIGKPLVEITDLVCERNQKMSEVRTFLAKDKIYNHYVGSINALIAQFKEDERVPEKLRNGINYQTEKSKVYSLEELTAYTIFNKPNLDKEKLPNLCKYVLDDISKLSLK